MKRWRMRLNFRGRRDNGSRNTAPKAPVSGGKPELGFMGFLGMDRIR